MKIDLPPMVIEKRIGNQLHILEVGEKVEKRIAWFGDKDFIAWIRE
jgi:hypothetical protein